jgi:DNA-binding NarL/FixJ family response regulator
MPPVRTLIADDHELFAETLGLALDFDERIDVVGSAHNGKDAVRLALRLQPDAVVMDLEMPVLDGYHATRLLGRLLPDCRVVVLTGSQAPEDANRARRAGATGYLTKGCSAERVIDALLDVSPASGGGVPRPTPAPPIPQLRL